MKKANGFWQRNRQRGVAAVEFALLLPLFLTLVLGAIDWGWFFFIDQLVTNAAREGARAGTLLPPPPLSTGGQAEDAAVAASNSYLTNVHLSATGVVALSSGGAIKVTIKYPVGSLTGFLKPVMPAKAVASASMRWQ